MIAITFPQLLLQKSSGSCFPGTILHKMSYFHTTPWKFASCSLPSTFAGLVGKENAFGRITCSQNSNLKQRGSSNDPDQAADLGVVCKGKKYGYGHGWTSLLAAGKIIYFDFCLISALHLRIVTYYWLLTLVKIAVPLSDSSAGPMHTC